MLSTKQDIINAIKNDQEYINEYIESNEYIYFNFKNYSRISYDKFFNQFKFNHPIHGIINMDKWDGKYFDIVFSVNPRKNRYIIFKITILEFNLKYCSLHYESDQDKLTVWIKEFLNDYKPNKKTEKSYIKEFNFIRSYFLPLGQKFNKYLLPPTTAIWGE